LSAAALNELSPYRAVIEPHWIDYNGHLRDAYYAVVFSRAIDDVMEQLGMGEEYRARTHCTLYTLELHFHYLHEVTAADELLVRTAVLDCDRKRFIAGSLFSCARIAAPVAAAEAVLLHVQQGDRPASAPFPAQIERRLQALRHAAAGRSDQIPRSRKLQLQQR